MPNVHFSFRRGAGDVPEILYGKVEIKPTLAFARGTSLVLPAPTTLDLVNGEATANNVYPTPAPVAGQVEWAYRVKAIDTRGQSFEWMVGVPDSTGTVEFATLPRYFETKPPLFGKGEKGDPGEAATIQIGSTTSGTTPSVTNTGTNQAAILNFVLPKGDKGDRGDGVPTGGTALQYLRKDAAGANTEWATLDKASVGLSNVDNTSDADKPISTAVSEAISAIVSAEDGRVAELIDTNDSLTRESLDKLFLGRSQVFVMVDDFGAIGDGVTDDTGAVQNAANSLKLTGGILYFSPGKKYLFDGFVELVSWTTVYAYGAVLKKRGPNNSYSVFITRSHGAKGYGSGGSNIIFAGGTYEGTFGAGASGIAVTLHHSENVVFKDVIFTQAIISGHAIDLGGCRNITIENCTFAGWSVAVSREYVEAIQLDFSLANGIGTEIVPDAYDGLPTVNVKVRNCKFTPLPIAGTTYPAPNPMGNHSRVENMWIENIEFTDNVVDGGLPTAGLTTGVAAYFHGWLHLFCARNVSILRNVFTSRDSSSGTNILNVRTPSTGTLLSEVNNPQAQSATIPLQPPTGYTFEGNIISGFGAADTTKLLNIQGAQTSRASVFSISRNSVYDCTSSSSGNFTPSSQYFLYLQDIDGVTVESNRLDGIGQVIYFYRGATINISGNTATRVTLVFSQIDACSRLVMQGNNLTYLGGMWFRAVDGLIISENLLNLRYSSEGSELAKNMVSMSGCSNVQVSTNQLDNKAANTFTTRGFYIYSTTRAGIVKDTLIKGDFLVKPIDIATNSSTVVESGTITGV